MSQEFVAEVAELKPYRRCHGLAVLLNVVLAIFLAAMIGFATGVVAGHRCPMLKPAPVQPCDCDCGCSCGCAQSGVCTCPEGKCPCTCGCAETGACQCHRKPACCHRK